MSQKYLQKLNYKIIKLSSSEDSSSNSNHKIISFENSWSSEMFCTYPQQIIIQFDCPVNLRQINIISHEKKISEKISFFSFCPQKDISIPNYNIVNYDNIGFINFNQNFASNFQTRELQKILINIKCLYLKIELEKNYINDYNPYHQVGLVNIDFYGYKLSGYSNLLNKKKNNVLKEEERKDEIGNNDNINSSDVNGNNPADEISGEKVNQLNNKLMESNKNQNYKECKLYKELISKAKELGNKIYALEEEKNEAIKIEDYDKATELKATIDSLKVQLYNLGEKRNSSANNNKNVISDLNNNNLKTISNTNDLDNTLDNQNNNSYFASGNNSRSFDSYNQMMSASSFNKSKDQSIEEKKKTIINYDEMVIPAITNKELKKNKSEEELDFENEQLYTLNPGPLKELEKDEHDNYSILIPFIGDNGLTKLLSNQIIYKTEGINLLMSELPKIFVSSNLKKILSKIIELISIFLDFKNNSITLKTFELISQLFQYMNINKEKINLRKKSIQLLNNRIISKIVNYFNNGVERIRKKAESLYIHIIKQNVLNFDMLIHDLLITEVENIDSDGDEYFISPVNVLCKLNILEYILNQYSNIIESKKSTKETFPIDIIIDYLVMNINNPKNQIKEKCRKVCNIAYQHFGADAFKDKLSFLDKKELDKLFKIKSLEPMMKSLSTNSLNNSKKNSGNNSPRPNRGKNIKNECNLCKQNIGNESKINHVKNCLMCYKCKKCKNYIEIQNLTEHKLYDCLYKNEYKLCDRCKEAIYIKSYEIHIKNKKCNPSKKNCLRCPLCHRDIPSNNEAFFQHLMIDGCPERDKNKNKIDEGV